MVAGLCSMMILWLCMYVCMHVCMYVCLYVVCMYVCGMYVYVCMYVCTCFVHHMLHDDPLVVTTYPLFLTYSLRLE